jgi:hypothetical protein
MQANAGASFSLQIDKFAVFIKKIKPKKKDFLYQINDLCQW